MTINKTRDGPHSGKLPWANSIKINMLAQAKFMYPWHDKFFPYILLGLGLSFNQASNYSTNVPPFLTFTRQYASDTATALAYKLGIGVDAAVTQHVRIGAGYRLSSPGKISLGSAQINKMSATGKLTQSNLYGNELLLQISYVV